MTQMLSHQALREWLDTITTSRELLAPVKLGGLYQFRPVSSAGEIAFDYDLSTVPPKEWFFPRADPLFAVNRENGKVKLDLPKPCGPRAMFGLRPCDARALTILDQPFLMEPADELYAQRRRNTVLVGLACAKQQSPECFCTSLDSGPQDSRYVDIMLYETGDGYAVKVVTDKGRALLASAELREGGEIPAAPAISNQVPAEGVAERIREAFNTSYWQRLADRCLGCKMCQFLCPTCHCFDVRDCQIGDHTERVRCWDGCQSSHFTRLAGGHNPRGSKAGRLRQFYAHKYLYFPERFGVTQCVGCGRCAHYCPVNIDIRETLRDLRALEV